MPMLEELQAELDALLADAQAAYEVAILTLYLIWRGIRVVEEREQGLRQSDQTIRDIESRLLHMETPP